jgi:N-acetylglucosaminyl-diphospho-decaprenol L-rhamnosyltransferase
MSSMPRASTMTTGMAVCIVNWNTRDLLVECLRHLFDEHPSYTVWVLDNGSTDGSAARLRETYPGVHLVESSVNRGFAGGVNELLQRCPADYLLVVNTDARPLPGAIAMLHHYMASHLWVAAVGPRLVDGNGRWSGCHDRFPTVRQEVANVLGLRRSRAHDDVRSRVDWIEGACMMLSAIAVREVGQLDTGYFMYNEEVDWCYRARKLGWQIACLPAARVVHFVGKSGSIRRRAQLCSSKIRYQRLHGSRLGAGALATMLVLINACLWLAYVIRAGWHADQARSHAYAVRVCARQLTGALQFP